MFTPLCNPIIALSTPTVECRTVKIIHYSKTLDAPPITISAKNFFIKFSAEDRQLSLSNHRWSSKQK